MKRSPVLQAILLADQVYVDTATDKKVIAGTFHRIGVAATPAVFDGPAFLYLCFRDVRPRDATVVEFVDSDRNTTLLEFEPIRLDITPEPVEIILPLPELPLPHPGTYSFDIFVGGRCVGAQRLYVLADGDDEDAEDSDDIDGNDIDDDDEEEDEDD